MLISYFLRGIFLHDWWGNVWMHYKFSPLASPSPCQDAKNDAFAGQNSRLRDCSQFLSDYSFRRKQDRNDGEVEHPVLLYRKILPEKLVSPFPNV